MEQPPPYLEAHGLTLAYGSSLILNDLNFEVSRGGILVIMGGSGSGKSTLLSCLIGLKKPTSGKVLYGSTDLWEAETAVRDRILRRCGVLYQSGALWSALTLSENVALPLRMYTRLKPKQLRELVALKLALVGLGGLEQRYPAELSGGMRKRAGLARAMALDPEILFADEPTSGLDPVAARRFDELLLSLRDALRITAVVVTHELASIFAIADDAVFLDSETKTILARGAPRKMLNECPDPKIQSFLTRGGSAPPPPRSPRGSESPYERPDNHGESTH